MEKQYSHKHFSPFLKSTKNIYKRNHILDINYIFCPKSNSIHQRKKFCHRDWPWNSWLNLEKSNVTACGRGKYLDNFFTYFGIRTARPPMTIPKFSYGESPLGIRNQKIKQFNNSLLITRKIHLSYSRSFVSHKQIFSIHSWYKLQFLGDQWNEKKAKPNLSQIYRK